VKYIKSKDMKFRSMTVAFAVLTMVGCKNVFEDNDVKVDGSTPFHTSISPAENGVYSASQPFKIESNFTDKDQVSEIDVEMIRLASSSTESKSVVKFKRLPQIINYKLDTTLAANSLAPGNYQMIIRAKDKRTNEGKKEFRVSVQ
jgi:hypothetical protein